MGNYAFIDSQNVNLAIENQGWRLDFSRFRVYLAEKYGVTRAFLFLGYLPEHSRLYQRLESFGFILIFKPIVYLRGHKVKGNVDAELVLHTMIEFENYDQAIIASGDGDFYCLLDYLKSEEKLLKLLIPDHGRYSALLKRVGSEKIDFMKNFRDKIEYKKAPIMGPFVGSNR
ncbi:MAG: NYN domain-containing protein [Parcubacteria group bacterium]|nr:NYN domain-containing protein [Parcubacteria group bacterium]